MAYLDDSWLSYNRMKTFARFLFVVVNVEEGEIWLFVVVVAVAVTGQVHDTETHSDLAHGNNLPFSDSFMRRS